MMNRFCAAASLLVALSGCATLSADAPDALLVDHGGAGGVSIERTGLLFGSIGFAPRDLSASAISFHLRSLDGKDHRFEIFATNRQAHPHWRAPEVDTEAQRIWVFSGRLPAGRYEIALAGVSGADPRDVHWTHFKPAIPVTVSADGAAYVGRWQLTPEATAVPGDALRVPGSSLVLRDLPEEDQLLLARRRGDSPIGKRAIDDALRNLGGQGG